MAPLVLILAVVVSPVRRLVIRELEVCLSLTLTLLVLLVRLLGKLVLVVLLVLMPVLEVWLECLVHKLVLVVLLEVWLVWLLLKPALTRGLVACLPPRLARQVPSPVVLALLRLLTLA